MPLDAIALGCIAAELDYELKDAKIEKIHQPERDELLLVIKTAAAVKKLAVSASSQNARVHFVDKTKENPMAPPMFCMLLRKHLTGGKILSVRRLGFERAVDIEISSRNEMGDIVLRHLICEIMGRNSNIIFTDDKMRIIDSIKHIDLTVSSVRNILPGLIYMPPPKGDKLDPEDAAEEDFADALRTAPKGSDAARAISDRVMGISPLLSEECIYRAIAGVKLSIGNLSEEDIKKIAKELYNLFEKDKMRQYFPCVLFKDDKAPFDFAAFKILQYESGARCVKSESMNEAAYQFYYMRDLNSRMRDRGNAIMKVISNNLRRAEKKLNILQCDLKAAEGREYYRICGELITANIYKIQKGDSEIKALNFYDENQEEIVIKLDPTLSAQDNAQKYFRKYKKAKNTQIYAKEQIEKTLEEISYLESVSYSVTQAQTSESLAQIKEELSLYGYIRKEKSKKKKEKQLPCGNPMEFSYNGYTIYVGRNNIQNDYLTLKIGRSRDLWLHAKNIPGSHTLVKYMGEDFPPDVIEKAASLAAYYSKGKNSPYVEVDYCPVSHVKKPSGARAGMVIYEIYKTAFVRPDGQLS